MNKTEILKMESGRKMDLLVARNIFFDEHKVEIPDYSTNPNFAEKVLEKIREKYTLIMLGNDLWECQVFLPTGKHVSSGTSSSFSLAGCRAALLVTIEEDRYKSKKEKKTRIQRDLRHSFMRDLIMGNKNKKKHGLHTIGFSLFLAGLVFLGCWNTFLAKEINKSVIGREGIKKNLEKVRIMEKKNRNGLEEVIRHKAIGLCFLELIGKHEDEYGQGEIERCVLLISIADERYRDRGLDASLIFAWIQKESAGNPKAISWAGAKGLTQLMDFRADMIFADLGYPGYNKKLVYNPELNLASGIYHLNELMRYWETQGIKNRSLVLFYAIHSYKWGSQNTFQLFNSDKKANRPAVEYVNWILNRREKWIGKMKNLIDNRLNMSETRKFYNDFKILDLFPLLRPDFP